MNDEKNLHLNDDQYLTLLKKVRKCLDTLSYADGFDDTTIGCKDTQCNVGLCNDEMTEKEFSMRPDEFPQRKVMKYRQEHHKCPLDYRPVSKEFRSGCFYTCLFFKKNLRNIEEIKKHYDNRINEVENE